MELNRRVQDHGGGTSGVWGLNKYNHPKKLMRRAKNIKIPIMPPHFSSSNSYEIKQPPKLVKSSTMKTPWCPLSSQLVIRTYMYHKIKKIFWLQKQYSWYSAHCFYLEISTLTVFHSITLYCRLLFHSIVLARPNTLHLPWEFHFHYLTKSLTSHQFHGPHRLPTPPTDPSQM